MTTRTFHVCMWLWGAIAILAGLMENLRAFCLCVAWLLASYLFALDGALK